MDNSCRGRKSGLTGKSLAAGSLPGPYQNVLLCGIRTQLQLIQTDWDELIQPSDPDFAGSGLHQASVIRLSYLYAADIADIVRRLLRHIAWVEDMTLRVLRGGKQRHIQVKPAREP